MARQALTMPNSPARSCNAARSSRVGFPRDRKLKCLVDGLDPCGECLGGVLNEAAVEQPERLESRRRNAALRAAGNSVGPIEEHLLMRQVAAALPQIDAAARGRSFVAGAATPGIELSRDGEDGIADRFGFESPGRPPPEELVSGINRVICSGERAGLPIRRRVQDQPVNVPRAPSTVDQFAGEEIEEFRVCGRRSLCTEVAAGLNESVAEVPLPDPVHPDTGHERVCGVRHPVGERQPWIVRLARHRSEDRGPSGRDFRVRAI